MGEVINLDINIELHPILKDVENIFWFYLLSNSVLADPEIQNIIKSKGASYLLSMLERYNKWVDLKIEINNIQKTYNSKMKLLNSSIVIGKAMAITMYELLKSSKYYKELKQLEKFNFLKHIRNGAAHNNKFHFKNDKNEWTLKEEDKIKWRDKELSIKLQDAQVFNDFISFTLVYMLAYDFSEKLKTIDKSQDC